MSENTFKVYALKYATRDAKAYNNFYGHVDPHEDYSMPMDYYIWIAQSNEKVYVIDAGFNEKVAQARDREFLRCPIETLKDFNISPSKVDGVIITHMHYDHIGNLSKFKNSNFIVQEEEMAFWTGKYASRNGFKSIIEKEDIVHLVKENFDSKIRFVNGEEEITPGLKVFKVGGHSAGLQVVSIKTKKGTMVISSDASHYYKNFQEDRPFSGVHNLAEMYDSFDLLKKVADNEELIIPGHDPEVTNKFPSVNNKFKDIIFELA